MIRSVVLAAGLLMSLTGCGALGALNSASTPLQAYELRLPDQMPRAGRTRAVEIIVEAPETSGALNTDAILIRPNRLQASYLPAAKWTDDVPVMVRTLLLRGLQQTGAYTYVGREPLGLGGTYAILSELTNFEGIVTPVPSGAPRGTEPVVRTQIGMLVQIVRVSDARIIATRRFDKTTPAASDSALDVAASLDRGMSAVMPDVAKWIMSRTGSR